MRILVDLCDLVDERGNRYGWLVAVDHDTDFKVFCAMFFVAEVELSNHQGSGGQNVLATSSGGGSFGRRVGSEMASEPNVRS